MKTPSYILLIFLVLAVLILAPSTIFVVQETDQGVVWMFGKPVRVIVNRLTDTEYEKVKEGLAQNTDFKGSIARGPGLYLKWPFLHKFDRVDARLLEYDEAPSDVITLEKIKPHVDSFARWRILNPLLFIQQIQTEDAADPVLRQIIPSTLRQQLGQYKFHELVRSTTRPIIIASTEGGEGRIYEEEVRLGREAIMARISKICDEKARPYGIRIIDVRIKRADLPQENANSVFERMKAERNRIATRFEQEGLREKVKIESDTDRQFRVILAEAARADLEIRGLADAEAAEIYASGFVQNLPDGTTRRIEGFGADPQFFHFLRRLQALEKTITGGDSLILTTDSPLFQVLTSMEPYRKTD